MNFNIGRYYQLPPYTALGYSNSEGLFLNKVNDLKYIRSDHFVAGLELIPEENIQFTLEGFYKDYSRYPFSVRDQVPLSSKSAGYGIFGDEELVSTSDEGHTGLSFLAASRNSKRPTWYSPTLL